MFWAFLISALYCFVSFFKNEFSFLEAPYFIDEATFKGTANQQRIVVGYLEDKLFPLPTHKPSKIADFLFWKQGVIFANAISLSAKAV